MGIIKFSLNMITRDKKQSLSYLACTAISISVMFNIFNIINNEYIMNNAIMKSRILSLTILSVLIGTVFFISIANYFYLIDKTKDIAIATIAGRNCVEVAFIFCFQNLGLGLVGTFLGIVLGLIISPIFNNQIYSVIGVVGESYYFSSMAILYTLLIIISQFIMIGVVDAGYVYRKEIRELISLKSSLGGFSDSFKFSRKDLIWVVLYCFPLITFCFNLPPDDVAQLMWVVIPVGILGLGGLIKCLFPKILKYLRNNKWSDNKVRVVSLSNLNYSLKLGGYLLMGIAALTSILLSLASHTPVPQLKIIAFLSYMVVQILMTIALIYKFVIDGISREKFFYQLRLLGYTKKDIIKIVKEEIILFFAVETILTLGQMLLMVSTHVYGGFLQLGDAVSALLFFIICNLIGGIISYIVYKALVKRILKTIR